MRLHLPVAGDAVLLANCWGLVSEAFRVPPPGDFSITATLSGWAAHLSCRPQPSAPQLNVFDAVPHPLCCGFPMIIRLLEAGIPGKGPQEPPSWKSSVSPRLLAALVSEGKLG